MKIDCLMGTYGRFSLACDALACFLAQTVLQNATLLIYNQHPVPLHFDHPRVRVVNVVNPSGTTLREIRAQMIGLADPDADYLHFWDDDDLYLPWHLEDCMNHIGDHMAWKPRSSWFLAGGQTYELISNTFEGSWMFQAEYLKSSSLETHPNYADIPVYMQTIESKLLATTELEGRSNYVYRWGGGVTNHSGLGASGSTEKQRQVMRYLNSVSTDVQDDGAMIQADLTGVWKHYLAGTRNLVTPEEWQTNKDVLGLSGFEMPHATSRSRPIENLVRRLNPFRSKS